MIDQLLRDKLVDAYMASIPLIILNLLWFICSLPIITLIPATAALFYATNQLAHGKPANWQVFFEGFRLYFRKSWPWGLMNLLVIAGLISNEMFYSRTEETWSVWLRGGVLALGVAWLSLQLYTFPLMLEQEQPRLRLALRNSLVILIKRPFFSVGQGLFVAVIMIGSTLLLWPVWIFITASVCAYLANQATLSAIAKVTGKSPRQTSVP